MVLRRRKRRGFSIDVFVKSRIIWQFFDVHERHKSEPSAPARLISASCLCLVATQAGRSLFRRIRIFQFFALVSSFSVGFDGFDKSGALIFNNAPTRALRFLGARKSQRCGKTVTHSRTQRESP